MIKVSIFVVCSFFSKINFKKKFFLKHSRVPEFESTSGQHFARNVQSPNYFTTFNSRQHKQTNFSFSLKRINHNKFCQRLYSGRCEEGMRTVYQQLRQDPGTTGYTVYNSHLQYAANQLSQFKVFEHPRN